MMDFYGNDQFLLNQVKQGQKKALYKNSLILGIILLCYEALLYGSVYVYYYFFYTLKTGKFTLSYNTCINYIRDNYDNISITEFEMLGNAFVTLLSLMGILIIARAVFKVKISQLFKCNVKDVALGVRTFPFALLLNYIFTVIIAILSAMFESSGIIIPDVDFSVDKPTFFAGFTMFMYMVVLAPIIEEVVYRGLVIKLVSPYGKKLAVFLSALIFGLMHGNLSQFVTAFVVGIIYATIALKTNSIIPTIVMHALNNGLNFIAICGEDYSSETVTTIYYVLFACVLLLGVMEIFLHRKVILKKVNETTLLSKSERIRGVFLNPAIILYFAYLVFDFVKAIVEANM